MDKINIEGVILTTLKKIHNPKGNIFPGMKKSDKGCVGFGEVYFTTIKYGEIKGWNRHKRMTLNLIVPVGEVTFVIYAGRKRSISNDNFIEVMLSPNNYQRLTIPPGVWLGFKGKSIGTNLILNIADMVHDPEEIERLDLDNITYNWDSI